jgi:hypothetical protein
MRDTVEVGVSSFLSFGEERGLTKPSVAPYGRIVPGRKDLLDEELGKKYWKWTEEQVKQYM